jgi:predicted TIM-barrel fold metal-dependent hydrolase
MTFRIDAHHHLWSIARSDYAWLTAESFPTIHRDWDAASLKPYFDVLIESFGPHRLMWGSDWPVLLLAGGYLQWLEIATDLTSKLSDAERAYIFGTTAVRFYGIKRN